MKLKILSMEDKVLFNDYLSNSVHDLSYYSFSNIFIWKSMYEIHWQIINDCLCTFFDDGYARFMYLPPLGGVIHKNLIEQCFLIMNEKNSTPELSRIENVSAKMINFFRAPCFKINKKDSDYVHLREDLSQLKGNRYKSKRTSCNHFANSYDSLYRPYEDRDEGKCMLLCDQWAKFRASCSEDYLYQAMLEDSVKIFKFALKNFANLDLWARVIEVGNNIVGYTFGYKLSADTFCVNFEVCDNKYKGAAQFIFRKICQELKSYKYINTMDDSGLENLKTVKNSYHPCQLVNNYTITRELV